MHIANDKPGPLDGIRVLDLTKTIAGPYCTMLLGDMGADVIKVEVPGKGDDFRHASPFVNGVSHYFLFANRNKRSITLDLKQESAKQILRKLAEKSDVIVENFRPGVVKKLRADYETISGLNPKVVYCSISGFGQTGPYRDRAAYDRVMQGMYGFISFLDDCNGKPPTPFAIPIADISAGLFAAYGICS
ncbi:MAG: CaiB/BaiF CoA transferase family protein, partial [Nitrososphaerales archaeon]